MRLALTLVCLVVATASPRLDEARVDALGHCPARANRAGDAAIEWQTASTVERPVADRWCLGVGPPIVISRPEGNVSQSPPALDELVVVTWNAHLGEARLTALIDALRAGHLTGGAPVRRFVLLIQELFRRGPDVPAMSAEARSAFAIAARDPATRDAAGYARTLGLSFVYVPSMRNGAQVLEDRGNAIVSTEPLDTLLAFELPFERQRRVAIGASIGITTPRGVERLSLLDAHLEPLSAPSTLWLFRNPRLPQASAIVRLMQTPRFDAGFGAVVGGDFNTIQGGDDEDAYALLREWSLNLGHEDRRSTHRMGRLDYLFFRGRSGWTVSTRRAEERFGSDHYPVVGRFLGQ